MDVTDPDLLVLVLRDDDDEDDDEDGDDDEPSTEWRAVQVSSLPK